MQAAISLQYTFYKYDDGICKRKSVGTTQSERMKKKQGDQPLKFRYFYYEDMLKNKYIEQRRKNCVYDL